MNLGQVTLAPVFPLWLIAVLLFLGFAASILQYWLIRKRLGGSRAFVITLLRWIALSLLISFALNPYIVARKEHRVVPHLAILVDTSQSMGLSGQKGGSRLDEARAILQEGPNSLLKSLSESVEITLYGLGESLKPIEVDELGSLKAGGTGGDLNEAMKKMAEKNAVAVLISDGNLKWKEGPSTNLPVLTIPVGDQEKYKDVLVKAVRSPSLAFRGRTVAIDVVIKSYGYPGLTVPVLLKEGTKLLTAKSARVNHNPDEVAVSLSFTSEEVGQHNLSVSIPSQVGESLSSNNTVNFSLKVVRDKIRVLMVSGNPSMNYRVIRTALKNDPSIDLLSFVILRTPSNIMNVPQQEQSLIPFPVDTIFSKELKTFDLVIFDNFLFDPYLRPTHLESIREFVRQGGGFAMVGGPNLANGSGYGDTPLEEVLPVRLAPKEEYRRDAPSGVKLSRPGILHPITRLFPVEADNTRLWQEMPPLDGINLWEPKNSGMVLLESKDGNSRPILVVGSYGKGRVLILATDYSWKWYTGMVAQGKSHWAYLRFVEKSVRWLTKDPDLDPVQMVLPERTGVAGEPVEFRIKLREENASSAPRGMVSLSVFDSAGMKINSQVKSAGPSGEYLASFLPERGGAYKVKVEASAGNLEESMIIVGPAEDLDAFPDHERLRKISASTGGKSLSKGDGLPREINGYTEKNQSRFTEEKQLPLWAAPYMLGLIVALLGTEWFLRRRWGLV